MGRGDRYQESRFSVPVSSGDVPGRAWPLTKGSACCWCAATKRFYHAPSRAWLCASCLAAQPKESR